MEFAQIKNTDKLNFYSILFASMAFLFMAGWNFINGIYPISLIYLCLMVFTFKLIGYTKYGIYDHYYTSLLNRFQDYLKTDYKPHIDDIRVYYPKRQDIFNLAISDLIDRYIIRTDSMGIIHINQEPFN